MGRIENAKDNAMNKLENAKDNAVGKVIEAAGKITNDQELEFSGKFQSLTSNVKERLYDVKEDVFQEANDIADKVNTKLKKKQ
jgi:uncharacterized protein YjbJ (UPF0337 family)